MIILILIIAAIGFIYFNVIPGKGHTICAWISLAFVALTIVGIVEHDYSHYGMKTKVETSSHQLVSSVNPKLPILLYQPLGNGTEKVYLYKTDNLQKKPKTTSTDHTSIHVTRSSTPKVVIKTTRYVYKNSFNAFMFVVFGHNNEFKKRQYNFYVPKNWQVLSTSQLKTLQARMKKMEAQTKLMHE